MQPSSSSEKESTMPVSSPAAQQSSDPEDSKPSNDGSQSPIQLKKGSAAYDAAKDQLQDVFKSLQEPEDRHFFHYLCCDGVLRIMHWLPTPLDEVTGVEVYDAKPLSPDILKVFLDETQEWTQEREDRYRGVDGRTVPEEQWFHPPPEIKLSWGTKNERLEEMRKVNEERLELEQKVARGELSKDTLGKIESDFDLRPR